MIIFSRCQTDTFLEIWLHFKLNLYSNYNYFGIQLFGTILFSWILIVLMEDMCESTLLRLIYPSLEFNDEIKICFSKMIFVC